jgi:hypothetical protein
MLLEKDSCNILTNDARLKTHYSFFYCAKYPV